MAWTVLPDGNLDVDSPARTVDALALRDNPIAIAGGLAGAPRNVDASLDTTPTTDGRDWVLARTAWAEPGALGSYAMLIPIGAIGASQTFSPGAEVAGSALAYANAASRLTAGVLNHPTTSPGGTWRLMGFIRDVPFASNEYSASQWLRIL